MENKNNKTCCCVGVSPKSFIWDYYDKTEKMHKDYLRLLAHVVEKQILDGFDRFLSCAAVGADLDFAYTVIKLKQKYPFIRLELVSAYPNNTSNKKPDDEIRYRQILNTADQHTVLFPCYTPWCIKKRNKYMVDKSDLLFVIWNGLKGSGIKSVIRYAENQKKTWKQLCLPPDPKKNFDAYFHYMIEGGLSLSERKKKEESLEILQKTIRR